MTCKAVKRALCDVPIIYGGVMSVVIVGGNDCMIRKYKDLCKEYNCTAKVFTHMKTDLKKQIGKPDLLVLFTNTMSHKMAKCAVTEAKCLNTPIERSHSSSASALKVILETYTCKI